MKYWFQCVSVLFHIQLTLSDLTDVYIKILCGHKDVSSSLVTTWIKEQYIETCIFTAAFEKNEVKIMWIQSSSIYTSYIMDIIIAWEVSPDYWELTVFIFQ